MVSLFCISQYDLVDNYYSVKWPRNVIGNQVTYLNYHLLQQVVDWSIKFYNQKVIVPTAQLFVCTVNLKVCTILQYKTKNSKLKVQKKTQTLNKSETFFSKAWRRGEDVSINNKKNCKYMEHKEIQKENSRTV